MEIVHELEGEILVRLDPEILASNVEILRQGLMECLLKDPKILKLDFSQTTILDSSGIGLLISTRNSLAAKNGEVVLLHVNPQILRMLKLMRLDKRFVIQGSEP